MSSVHAAFGLDEVKGKPSMRTNGFVANIEASQTIDAQTRFKEVSCAISWERIRRSVRVRRWLRNWRAIREGSEG